MSTCAVIRPEVETEAPVTFAMHCTACGAASVPGADFGDAYGWATRHAGRNPAHTRYREIIHRHWRATVAC